MIGLADTPFVEQIWWYTSRAAGIVAWVLLSTSVIAGMSISSRDSRRLPTGWTLDLHRFLSTLSLTFLGVHLVALVPDDFVHFAWMELFVPMASEWEPAAVAWGVVAFWLVVAVEITSLLRTRMPNRLWKLIHLLSFVIWVSATIHLFEAGTDADATPFRVAQGVVIISVSTLFVRRIVLARRRSSARVGSLPIEEAIDVDEVDSREGRELSARGR